MSERLTTSQVGAQGYVKVAIRYRLATLLLNKLPHMKAALGFLDETYGSQNIQPKAWKLQ